MKIVILAGGQGTRLWPLSTIDKPKQFQSFGKAQTLLQATVERVKFLGLEHIFVATLQSQKHLVVEQCPEILQHNIIAAPASQDSAMGIAFALEQLRGQVNDSDLILFMPSDHDIEPADAFELLVKRLKTAFISFPEKLFTVGLMPKSPSTRFGYIETVQTLADENILEVKSFREKPDKTTAEHFLATRNFYWNAGLVMGSFGTLVETFEQVASKFLAAAKAGTTKSFASVPKLSFDYAVWEPLCLKKEKVACVLAPPEFVLNDLGNFENFSEFGTKQVQELESNNCLVLSENQKKIVLLGCKNLVVVESDSGILVADKDKLDLIKKVQK